MKIIAFAGSNSRHSINRKFVAYAAGLFENAEAEVLDLNDYEMPLFSVDLEKKIPPPEAVGRFLEKMGSADLLVVSLAENNSSFNAGFKNLFDWNSRTNTKQFQGKPMLLLSTSPGKRGGASVLAHAKAIFPFYGADIKATFSLPAFYENFNEENGVINPEYDNELKKIVSVLTLSLSVADK